MNMEKGYVQGALILKLNVCETEVHASMPRFIKATE